MQRTGIEWVKNPDGTQGYTWNPITGCLNGCEYCYARKLANTRLRTTYIRNFEIALPHDNPKLAFNDPFYPRFWPERLMAGDKFLKSAKKPLGIFPCDMSDWCGIGIPESWSDWIIEEARRYPLHRFYLLTKQPQNLAKFSPFPDNCRVGFTACNREMLLSGCLAMNRVDARVKYISIEPMLTEIWCLPSTLIIGGINWIIIGAQTKPYKPPEISWVEDIVGACDKAGVKVFLKDNLSPLFTDWTLPEWARFGNKSKEHPLRYRQEMPE